MNTVILIFAGLVGLAVVIHLVGGALQQSHIRSDSQKVWRDAQAHGQIMTRWPSEDELTAGGDLTFRSVRPEDGMVETNTYRPWGLQQTKVVFLFTIIVGGLGLLFAWVAGIL